METSRVCPRCQKNPVGEGGKFCDDCIPAVVEFAFELWKQKRRKETPTKLEFYELTGAKFQEDQIWSRDVKPRLANLPRNVVEICNHGFSEIANNANDHGETNLVFFSIDTEGDLVQIRIVDFGVGIFEKIKQRLGLPDARQAIFELGKGKLTTDPERHTGEGIFFTSRMFDDFFIISRDLSLHYNREEDWLMPSGGDPIEGTYVVMRISKDSARTCKEVFDKYTGGEEEDYGFNRTTVAVTLTEEGDTLVSRSQAKRIMARLENFKEVFIDFTGIVTISPAFADEIFRVFQNGHPEVDIIPVRAVPDVMKMIDRARANRDRAQTAAPASDDGGTD